MSLAFGRVMFTVLAGPLIWAAHFLLIYVFNAMACARPALNHNWMGAPISSWAIGCASVLALLALSLVCLRRRAGRSGAGDPRFVSWLAVMLALLSAVAVVWETLPVLLLTPCARA